MPGPGTFLIDDIEKKEVEEVLESGYLSRYGREGDPRFKRKVITLEREFARKIGVDYCVAVNGGTGALMASLVALGVGPGVEVLVSGYTFVASISAIIAVGGEVAGWDMLSRESAFEVIFPKLVKSYAMDAV